MNGRVATSLRRALFGAAALACVAGPAAAGGYVSDRDRVHADSFGNLVIHSPAGYKRIIVGMGEAASGYQATGSYYEPASASAYGPDERRHDHRAYGGCAYGPAIIRGRSHMYGLPDGVVPVPSGPCR